MSEQTVELPPWSASTYVCRKCGSTGFAVEHRYLWFIGECLVATCGGCSHVTYYRPLDWRSVADQKSGGA